MKKLDKFIAFSVVLLFFAGCTQAVETSQQTSNTPITSTTDKTVTTTSQSAITISNFQFNPASTTVKAGTTVTWTNQDSVPHKIMSSDSTPVFASGELAQGDSYSFTFATPGTFNYYCQIHPMMKGIIVVQ